MYHLDTDFLVYAIGCAGPERERLLSLSETDVPIQISSIAWYEYSRGPRRPEQLAAARSFFLEDGVVPFSEEIAGEAAMLFQSLGSPRRRAADVAIAATAIARGAILLSRNSRDFEDMPGLRLD